MINPPLFPTSRGFKGSHFFSDACFATVYLRKSWLIESVYGTSSTACGLDEGRVPRYQVDAVLTMLSAYHEPSMKIFPRPLTLECSHLASKGNFKGYACLHSWLKSICRLYEPALPLRHVISYLPLPFRALPSAGVSEVKWGLFGKNLLT